MKENLKVVISGGGTGGHIFPAIAIADALKRRFPEADILFIGAKGRMEMERVPKAGYPIEGLWISGMTKDLKSLLLPLKLTSSINHAIAILKRFKPDVVIGVGGFASGPTLMAATPHPDRHSRAEFVPRQDQPQRGQESKSHLRGLRPPRPMVPCRKDTLHRQSFEGQHHPQRYPRRSRRVFQPRPNETRCSARRW